MTAYDLLIGDCRETLKTLPDKSVHCVITSPPYFGLRDYGIEGQIGLENRVPLYISGLIQVFEEVHRVLRDDGVIFVNIGDTYAGFKDGKFTAQSLSKGSLNGMPTGGAPHRSKALLELDGFRHKELMGIPWRFAFAMRDAGYLLRQEIIWKKPNYRPESVRDRFVRSHEHIFLFAKQSKYFFDGDAVRIPTVSGEGDKLRSSVWEIPVSSYKGAHFATFPPSLVEPCVIAGCPIGGTVLDPFGGSGTTGGSALKKGRKAIICELNPDYAGLIDRRVKEISGLSNARRALTYEDLI